VFEIAGLQAGARARWIHALTAGGRFVVDSFFISLNSDLASNAAHAFTSLSQDGPRSPPSIIPIADVNQGGCGVLEMTGKVGRGVVLKVGVVACEAVVAKVEVPPEARVCVGWSVVADF